MKPFAYAATKPMGLLVVSDPLNRSDFMKRLTIVCSTVLVIASAFAGEARAADSAGYSAVHLNIRSGPSVRFPAVGVLGAGSALTIHGCIARYTWCDISTSGLRGWASGANIQFVHEARRVYVPAYAAPVEIPVVAFDLSSYWHDYYRDSSFYGDLDRWSTYHWEEDGSPPGWRDNWGDDDTGHEY
jgi:uncharacterized protein YraI